MQERQGREGIIRDLERKRGTVSTALESVSHAIRIKRARPTITKGAQGNKSQLLLLLLPSTVKCEVLSERRRRQQRREKMFNFRPTGVLKSVRVCVCVCAWACVQCACMW